MRCNLYRFSKTPPELLLTEKSSYSLKIDIYHRIPHVLYLLYKAILEAIKSCGKEGPRSTQPGLAGVFLVLNKVAGQESKLVITVRGELSAAARTLDVSTS